MGLFSDIVGAFTSGVTRIAPLISLIPGVGTAIGTTLSVAGNLLGATKQTLTGVQQQTQLIATQGGALPFITPTRDIIADPVQVQAGIDAEVAKIVGEIRRGIRSRSNVPPRLASAVDAALGSFVFGQAPVTVAGAGPAKAGEGAIARWQAEVLAGTRSFDNFPPGVSSSMKRELAARVLKLLGPGFLPESFRPSPAVTSPLAVAGLTRQQPILEVLPMPTRQLGAPVQQAGFLGFGGNGTTATAPNIPLGGTAFGVPAVAGISGLARAFAGIMKRSGIGRGLGAIVQWARGNPGTATAIAISAGLTVDELIDSVSEQALTKAITGGVVLSRNDLKGFNRTVRVAKKLKVFARRAPRRARSLPGHRHSVRSHR